ncbi:MAG: hypothetical protein IK048_05360 [Clostridia bacterium]|nr:hypothetical protein [Clostridia bacterium]
MARQKYALVRFKPFGKDYTYSCGDDVKEGNVVLVGVGDGKEQKRAVVTEVCYFAEGALPCPAEQIREIIEVVEEEDYNGEFFEDMNVLFAREEPRLMNALWSRAEDYDEYPEQLPLYGDIEHKYGGRITVFKTMTEFVIRYAIRDFAEGRYVAYSKGEMLGITKNLKCGIDFYMRHRDKVGDEFVEELFESPTVIPEIYNDTNFDEYDEFED